MKPVILVILDGWGASEIKKGNAVKQAKTPIIDKIEKSYPTAFLQASGIAVGMPWGEAGNSEVGHLTLGAGRTIYQSVPRIVFAIKDGSFFKNPALVQAVQHVKKNNSVHSYIEHLYGLIELAKREKIKLRLHIFTDGEDAPPKEASKIVKKVEEKLSRLKNGKIATVMGRVFPMDRNNNWELIERAYNSLTKGEGLKFKDPVKAIEESYNKGLNDTFVEPSVMVDQNNHPLGLIQDNDSIVFFNFRRDRGRQLTKAFVLSDFKEFSRKQLKNLYFVTMTEYEKGLPVKIAFPPIEVNNHLTEVLSNLGKKTLKIAETEKYAHVTYFFNGGKEKVYPGEKRILVPSKTIPQYDKFPEMAASDVTENIIQGVKSNKFYFILVNYANTDMVAHTGDFQATIKAVETVDSCLNPLLELAEEEKCYLLITADHGNAEEMIDLKTGGNAEEMIDLKTGEPMPEHSTNPVPFYLVEKKFKRKSPGMTAEISNPQGILSDVAPTVLELMKIPQPPEMTGRSLLEILK